MNCQPGPAEPRCALRAFGCFGGACCGAAVPCRQIVAVAVLDASGGDILRQKKGVLVFSIEPDRHGAIVCQAYGHVGGEPARLGGDTECGKGVGKVGVERFGVIWFRGT